MSNLLSDIFNSPLTIIDNILFKLRAIKTRKFLQNLRSLVERAYMKNWIFFAVLLTLLYIILSTNNIHVIGVMVIISWRY